VFFCTVGILRAGFTDKNVLFMQFPRVHPHSGAPPHSLPRLQSLLMDTYGSEYLPTLLLSVGLYGASTHCGCGLAQSQCRMVQVHMSCCSAWRFGQRVNTTLSRVLGCVCLFFSCERAHKHYHDTRMDLSACLRLLDLTTVLALTVTDFEDQRRWTIFPLQIGIK
jgi:hypothetical protein